MNTAEILRNNLDAVSKVDTQTLRWLENSDPDPNIRAEKNLYVVQPDGQHNAYYPSEPSIASEIRNIGSMDLPSGTLTCLIGMGLGYTARAVLDSMDRGHVLMVIEPNPHIVKLAFERFDFSRSLLSKDLIVLPPDKGTLQTYFLRLMGGGIVHKDVHVLPDPRSVALFPKYRDWVPAVEQVFKQATLTLSGETEGAKQFVLNELENLVHVSLSPGIENLKKNFAGRPMLIVGAGPSLDHSLHRMPRMREKTVIIAFSGSFRILLAHGIKPHLVVAGDKNRESVGTIRHTAHAHHCPLIYSSRVHPDFLEVYTGPCFAVPDAGPLGAWVMPLIGKSVGLHTGINVAVFALQIADYLEGDPIILTGMDLAFGEYSHGEGHPFRSRVKIHSHLFPVEGVGGTTVKTSVGWHLVREAIEEQIRSMHKPVINATAEGAKLHHTKEATLEEIDKTYPKMKPIHAVDASFSTALLDEPMPPLSKALSGFLSEAEQCLTECRKGVETSEAYSRSFNQSTPEKERLRRIINRHTTQVENLMARYPFLNFYMGDLLLKAKIANAQILQEPDESVRFALEVEKNHQALSAFAKEIRPLMDVIRSTVRDLENLNEILCETKSRPPERGIYRRSLFLFRHHLYEAAVSEIEKALSMRADFPEALLLLAEICLKKRRFADAERWVEKAVAIEEGSEAGKKLLSTIEKAVGALHKEKEAAVVQNSRIDERLISKELDLS